jgi:hypothetical protein
MEKSIARLHVATGLSPHDILRSDSLEPFDGTPDVSRRLTV